MTKLYYTATSCGAASFMAAKASGLTLEAEEIDLSTHRTKVGDVDFYSINPKGNVPTVVTDDGTVINENVATLSYIGDLKKDNPLFPSDPSKRAQVINALAYIATEWHQTIGQLFNPMLSKGVQDHFRAVVAKKLTYMNDHLLKDKTFIAGDDITVADFYAVVTLSWPGYLGVDLSPYPVVEAYFKTVGAHPFVTDAKEAMATSPTTTN